jgi:hypothetical protein
VAANVTLHQPFVLLTISARVSMACGPFFIEDKLFLSLLVDSTD